MYIYTHTIYETFIKIDYPLSKNTFYQILKGKIIQTSLFDHKILNSNPTTKTYREYIQVMENYTTYFKESMIQTRNQWQVRKYFELNESKSRAYQNLSINETTLSMGRYTWQTSTSNNLSRLASIVGSHDDSMYSWYDEKDSLSLCFFPQIQNSVQSWKKSQ